MNIDKARQKAMEAWSSPANKNKPMDSELVNAFTDILRYEVAPLEDELEAAWGIIANAGGGDWRKESVDWREAAAKWRDRYHTLLKPVFLRTNPIHGEHQNHQL